MERFSPPFTKWHYHTINCANCRHALTNSKRVWLGVTIAGEISWAALPLVQSPFLFLMLSLLAGATWWRLDTLKRRFYEGRTVPLRNLLEKKWG